MRALLLILGLVLSPWALPGQDLVGMDDFLSDHEEDLIRLAQDPNDRIQQYLVFAQLRLELVNQKLAVEKAGRAADVHRNLEQFGQIIETIDIVIDDALVRKVDLTVGIEAFTEQGGTFLANLQKIKDTPAKDQWAYEFVLADAILITEDTIEMAQGDLTGRREELEAADARQEEKRLESMAPALREEVTEVKKEQQKKEAERKRKRPTLRKPGEKDDKK